MKILILGTGYVGLVTGACLAELGNRVTCYDIDEEKINSLLGGSIPFFEPGLEKIVKENIDKNRLFFVKEISKESCNVDIIFIAVGTPAKENGEVNLSFVEEASREIAKNLSGYTVVVNKSTVPVGSGVMVKNIIAEYYKEEFDVASNPEFLREGDAIDDFMNPERIIIGTDSERSGKVLRELYSSFRCPLVSVSIETAEMIKYASNAFLATKISFINEIANVCERVGANVDDVAFAMGLDSRIGNKFLKPGIGYGGSCFPKDVRGLNNIALKNNYDFELLKSVIKVNSSQKEVMLEKAKALLGDLNGRNISIWGLSFKPNTDDFRESIGIYLAHFLCDTGANVKVYDPLVDYKKVKKVNHFSKEVIFSNDKYEVLKDCEALMVVTEWQEFKDADMVKIKSIMKESNIIDGRNIFDLQKMKELGFNYLSIGR